MTESGSNIDDNFLQPSKADSPICVTDSGIVMDFSPLQFQNKPSAIDVIEFGSDIDINSVQP